MRVSIERKESCCGCGACVDACPTSSIVMAADEEGFLYPSINEYLCVDCGRCVKVCAFQNLRFSRSEGPYFAAVAEDVDLSKSASGGIFASMAAAVVRGGGAVCGCGYGQKDGVLVARHEMAETPEDLERLRGSKYVQSSMVGLYRQVKSLLDSGRPLLFCGTPCQVAGLRGFLGDDRENLLLIDLICHGVPSQMMFSAYQRFLIGAGDCEVADFVFRDKGEGWNHSLVACVTLEESSNMSSTIRIPASDSSYYDLFLKFETFRPSCYSCPYANCDRPGDLTIGDFWGIENRRLELLSAAGGPFSMREGISCLLVNDAHGLEWLGEFGCGITMREVDLLDITDGNSQLRSPCRSGCRREEHLAELAERGYGAVEAKWAKRHRIELKTARFKRLIPADAKRIIRCILKRSSSS